ncbi:MAG: TIGR01212 family radical SAM protein [Muribaculaceae bacterium]|nr:TIGR01212 family radical SAM protein [Muribaculaceae bacterium]
MNPYYKDYSEFLAEHLDGKVQKLTVDAGFTCPNRDGSLGRGGCIYCNNTSFSPTTGAKHRSVTQQLQDGKRFFSGKYPDMKYLAYFQSYTNTYAAVDDLMALYAEALEVDDIVGIIIGTRPDCMPDELLDRLSALNREKTVIIEYGAESSHDSTLEAINRCHTWSQTVDAVLRTHKAGIPVGLHFILGLPGENRDMIMETVDRLNALPVDCVKFHQLQIINGTRLGVMYRTNPGIVTPFDVDTYVDLCTEIVNRLRDDIAIERFVSQSPDNLLIAPRWGLKNYEFTHRLHKHLEACKQMKR